MLVTAKKYNETGDSKYLEFSKKVFNGLNSPVLNQDGWLLGVVTGEKYQRPIGRLWNLLLFV